MKRQRTQFDVGSMSGTKENHAPIYQDLLAAGAILLYSVICGAVRLAASPTMEMDETEQFLASAYSWQNYNQPPLYTQILKGIYSIAGASSAALIGIKYVYMFFFFFIFYAIARKFWKPGHSLVLTASLSLYSTYSYNFARHLTHTVLVAFCAAAAFLAYLLIMDGRKKYLYYAAFGILAGLGILAKYNFVFFLSALVLASVSCGEGRKVLRDKGVFIAMAAAVIIIAPHYLSMFHKGFPALSYALERTGAGQADIFGSGDFFHFLKVFFLPILPLAIIFCLFFGSSIVRGRNEPGRNIAVVRWIGFYALTIPFVTHLLLGSANYSERWLAPVFFLVPIALFSYVRVDACGKKISYFGYLCLAVLFSLLLFRMAAGFFPDLAGKVERIHMPFREISLLLQDDLRKMGVRDLREVSIGSDSGYVTANIAAEMPGIGTSDLRGGRDEFIAPGTKRVLIWNAKIEGEIPERLEDKLPAGAQVKWLKAAYLHSKKFPPFILGYAVLPSEEP